MKKIDSCELLNYIYKIANISILRINSIYKKVNKRLFKILNKQKEEYLKIAKESKKLLNECGGIKENIALIDKINNGITLFKDNDGIILLLINNYKKSYLEINKKFNSYDYSEVKVTLLAFKLNKILEKNINVLKKYL